MIQVSHRTDRFLEYIGHLQFHLPVTVPGSKEKIAYLVEKGVDSKVLGTVLQEAMAGRAAGQQILVAWMNKNKKFQKEQLIAEGYSEFKEFYKEALK